MPECLAANTEGGGVLSNRSEYKYTPLNVNIQGIHKRANGGSSHSLKTFHYHIDLIAVSSESLLALHYRFKQIKDHYNSISLNSFYSINHHNLLPWDLNLLNEFLRRKTISVYHVLLKI